MVVEICLKNLELKKRLKTVYFYNKTIQPSTKKNLI